MKKRHILLTTLLFTFLISTTVFAAEVSPAQANALKFGAWTLIPPFVAIVLAFITKNVVISLAAGVMSGTFILSINGFNVFDALFKSFLKLVDTILGSLADPWNAGVLLQCLAIGGLIAVVSKMGGAKAIAESLAKKAKTPMSAQLITWLLGMLVFFDDYANSLIVGPIMRPVTDKLRISREKLSFIVDATAAPIAGLALISTWIGYEVSTIKAGFAEINPDVNAYGVFIQTIPFRFYNILILAFIFFTAIFLKEFGPMLKAERRARATGKVIADNAKPMVSEEMADLEPKAGLKLSIWNAIIPIGVLILGAFAGFYYNGYNTIMGGEDQALIQLLTDSPASFSAIQETFGSSDASVVLFQAALLASVVAIIMAVAKKAMTLGEAVDTWVSGMKSLLITGVILILAWSLSSTIKELGTAAYLSSLLAESLPPFILPSIIFIFGSIISFATGTSYGTMGILMPLAIPLANAIALNNGMEPMSYIIMTSGAVLTGAIFGDHCSPISDTTILSSMGSSSDHMDHVKTQLPYALAAGAVTIVFGYIPVGLNLPVYIVLPVSIAVMGLVVYFVGKPVVEASASKSSGRAI